MKINFEDINEAIKGKTISSLERTDDVEYYSGNDVIRLKFTDGTIVDIPYDWIYYDDCTIRMQ